MPSPPPRYSARRSRSRSPVRRYRSRSPARRPRLRSPTRRSRSRSPIRRRRSRSPPRRRRSQSPARRSRARSPIRKSSRRSRSNSPDTKDRKSPPVKPNFELSGKLAAETNSYNGVALKYHEPPEARKPLHRWRLYVFKGSEQLDLLHIHRQSAYLLGRDRHVADIPIDHPSCSKQHAAVQYRQISEKDEYGQLHSTVKPYIIDLESSNGTYVNGERIPTTRYFELKLQDVIKFGFSTREYVLMYEELASDNDDDEEET